MTFFTYKISINLQLTKTRINTNFLLSNLLDANFETHTNNYSIQPFEKTLRLLKKFQKRFRFTQRELYLVNFPVKIQKSLGVLYQIEVLNLKLLSKFFQLRLFRKILTLLSVFIFKKHILKELTLLRKINYINSSVNILKFIKSTVLKISKISFLKKILKKKKFFFFNSKFKLIPFFKNFKSLKFLVNPWYAGRLSNKKLYAKFQVPVLYKARCKIPSILLFYSDFDRLTNKEFSTYPFFSLNLPDITSGITEKIQTIILALLLNSWRLTLFSRSNLNQILRVYNVLMSYFMSPTKQKKITF